MKVTDSRIPNRGPTVAVMHPYFLPYLPYFALVRSVEIFVIFDSAQYRRQGWINRNVIPSTHSEGEYLRVPVSAAPQSAKIADIRIANQIAWRDHLDAQLQTRYGKAAYYASLRELLFPVWDEKHSHLLPLLVRLLASISSYLGFSPRWEYASKWEETPREELTAEKRVLGICQKLNAASYVNLPGGTGLYSEGAFAERGIALEFLPSPAQVSRRSIVDALAHYGPSTIREQIDGYLSQNVGGELVKPIIPSEDELRAQFLFQKAT